MPFEAQPQRIRSMVIGPKKQTTYGTALLDASLTHRLRPDPNMFSKFSKEFVSDKDRVGKAHPWPTFRTEIARDMRIGGQIEAYGFAAAWACAFLFSKVTTTGAGPYTHTFVFEQSTIQAPVTGIYIEDTADLKYKINDLALTSLSFSGSERGPIAMAFEMIGSGRYTDGSMTLPALPTVAWLLGSDTDILIGAPGAAASIKERVRGWQVSLTSGINPHRAPGGGMYSSMHKIGIQGATLSLKIAAKSVDDLRSLFVANTLQEVKINTTTGAEQLNITFPGVYLSDAGMSIENGEVVWDLTVDENSVMKGVGSTPDEIVQVVVINATAAYLAAG